jgi:hypothetical protein
MLSNLFKAQVSLLTRFSRSDQSRPIWTAIATRLICVGQNEELTCGSWSLDGLW